jgi:acetolactate synthase regulatory subunit
MSAPAPSSALRAERGSSPLQVVLDIADTPEALVRILATVRRRRTVVVRAEYLRGGRGGRASLALALQPPGGRAEQLEAWLGNLVDVISVSVADSWRGAQV